MDPDGTIAPLLLTLFILVAASAFFSMCESAMVTLSDSRLKRLVEDGDNRARKLLDKLDHPSRFLATVQAGVTLCGLFAAGLVCDRFAGVAVNALAGHGIASPWLHPLAVFLITLVLAFVLLVFGKLLPGRRRSPSPLLALTASLPPCYCPLWLRQKASPACCCGCWATAPMRNQRRSPRKKSA